MYLCEGNKGWKVESYIGRKSELMVGWRGRRV
jgi:hypothetical protein